MTLLPSFLNTNVQVLVSYIVKIESFQTNQVFEKKFVLFYFPLSQKKNPENPNQVLNLQLNGQVEFKTFRNSKKEKSRLTQILLKPAKNI